LISICGGQNEEFPRERDTLSAGNCNVLLCFITNYTYQSLKSTLFLRSNRPVLIFSRFQVVSIPKFSENKHSGKNEAFLIMDSNLT
jgi:hypothetical protein